MTCTCDPVKHARTLAERGLDMIQDAEMVFAGAVLTTEDDRFDYGETRYITVGFLRGRMVIVVWTPRGEFTHIISMRKANDREQKAYTPRF